MHDIILSEEAQEFCGNIGYLLASSHTSGPWSNGLAVQELFWRSFGHREGLGAVAEHMQFLNIEANEDWVSVLELTLRILVGSRCDSVEGIDIQHL